MSILKCKMCGGDLEVIDGSKIAECEFCGTRQTVPGTDDEKKTALFNRANRLRIANEFDKAAGVYESIVTEFSLEAEAYWGLVLCKYGIEYVDDPKTGKKVPTCHRSSFESVTENENFKAVLNYSDTLSRSVYIQEAENIEEIRKGIVEVSSKEEPYDIFICYKETAPNGDRTLDSVIAQEVYDALTQKGYRVFFSRITLEDKLGQEYEPYIFAALNSAKIMLAFGTDFDYYNAVWVKNEWSRFLELIEKGEKKTLIPCYKNIDAYDMPKEFARLQAQDMGKVGAIQDLLRGIDKIIPKNTSSAGKEAITISGTTNTEPIIKRALSFLEQGNFEKADELSELIFNFDVNNSSAYLIKLMAELHIKKVEELPNHTTLLDTSENYQKLIEIADNKLKETLISYNNEIKQRMYENAVQQQNNGKYNKAIEILNLIPNWNDAEEILYKCQKLQAEKNKKKIIILSVTASICVFFAIATLLFFNLVKNHTAGGILYTLEDGHYVVSGYADSLEQPEVVKIKSKILFFPVTEIAPSAFHQTEIKEITLGENIEIIGDRAFRNCPGLTNITLPQSVTHIGDSAFSYCYNLTSINIPKKVTFIGENSFFRTKKITSVTFESPSGWWYSATADAPSGEPIEESFINTPECGALFIKSAYGNCYLKKNEAD